MITDKVTKCLRSRQLVKVYDKFTNCNTLKKSKINSNRFPNIFLGVSSLVIKIEVVSLYVTIDHMIVCKNRKKSFLKMFKVTCSDVYLLRNKISVLSMTNLPSAFLGCTRSPVFVEQNYVDFFCVVVVVFFVVFVVVFVLSK